MWQERNVTTCAQSLMVNSTLYKKRHNAMVGRNKKATSDRWNVESEDQAVGGTRFSPDLVLKKDKDIIFIDMTIPFENGPDAFEVARKAEGEKYDVLAKDFMSKGFRARVEAVIIGSLGSWDSENDGVLKRLCSNK